MALPMLLGAVAKGFMGGGGMSMGAVAKKAIGLPGGKRKHRRRRRLTQSDMMELNQIKSILGKTAAANALPYYVGRR